MKMTEIAAEIQELRPDASVTEVSTFALLILNAGIIIKTREDLELALHDIGLRHQAACDQHAAMLLELVELAQSDPKRFKQDEIWVLIRAISVQSQIIQMYVGEPAEET